MALGKLEGVTSVEVTLKRGVAHIALKPENTLTLAQLRQTVKDAGYTSGEAVATAVGRLSAAGGQKVLSVTGTAVTWVLEPAPGTPAVAALAGALDGAIVQVTGTIPASSQPSAPERITVRELTSIR